MTANRVSIFVAGDTGHVGHDFMMQLQARVRAGAPYQCLGAANTRRVKLTSYGDQPRRDGDWETIITRLTAHNPVVFIDCTASAEVASLYPRLLEAGIGIITPNKLALSGPLELYQRLHRRAQQGGIPFLYETTVGADLPVLRPLADLRTRGEKIIAIEGVLSGTMSFLCSRLNDGISLSDATRESVERGYAEPHPARDLSGEDVLRKLVILLRTAGIQIEPEHVLREPLLPKYLANEPDPEKFLSRLRDIDAEWEARRSEQPLACIASYRHGQAQVGLENVGKSSPFAHLAPGENMFRIYTDRYHATPLTIAGPGAGTSVTAAGIITDLAYASRLFFANRMAIEEPAMCMAP